MDADGDHLAEPIQDAEASPPVTSNSGQLADNQAEQSSLTDTDTDTESEKSDEPIRKRLENEKKKMANEVGRLRIPRSTTPSDADVNADADAVGRRKRKVILVDDGLIGDDDAVGDSDYVEDDDEEGRTAEKRKVKKRAEEIKKEVHR